MPFTPPAALVACLSLIALALALGGGCAKSGPADKMKVAQMKFENHTDFSWKVTLLAGPKRTTKEDAAGKTLQLAPRAVSELEVEPGTYRLSAFPVETPSALDTWMLAPEGEEMELKAGSNYVWPLSTLLSDGKAGL